MATIETMQVDLFRLALPIPVEASAAGLMKGFDMVAVRLTDKDGVTGSGYTVLHEGQGASVAKVADLPFREILMGQDPEGVKFYGRGDLVEKLGEVDPTQIPWQEMDVNI